MKRRVLDVFTSAARGSVSDHAAADGGSRGGTPVWSRSRVQALQKVEDLKVLSVLVPFKDVWLRLRWVLKDGSIGFWVTGSAGQSLEPVSP